MDKNLYSRPIRLILSGGDYDIAKFSIVYENADGSAGTVRVWEKDEIFQLIRFVDDESVIVFEKKLGFLDTEKSIVKEIRINRSFQLK